MRSLFGIARNRTWDLSIPSRTFYHCSTATPRKEKGYVVGAGDYSHDRLGQEEVHGERVARSSGGG